MVVTDLDGTFLNDAKTVSTIDVELLNELGKQGILRVAATGRNLKKVHEVIPLSMPFDYVLFSSGAGIFNWNKQEIEAYENLSEYSTNVLIDLLIENGIGFKVNKAIPDNHKFFYYRGNNTNSEFEWYINEHSDEANEYNLNKFKGEACQLLIILPYDLDLFDEIKTNLTKVNPMIRVIKTTSPISSSFLWMEVFPISVSKGHGLELLCRNKNLSMERTFCLGNDFNDLDMLRMTAYPMLVRNADATLKDRFPVSLSDNNHHPLKNALVRLNDFLQ